MGDGFLTATYFAYALSCGVEVRMSQMVAQPLPPLGASGWYGSKRVTGGEKGGAGGLPSSSAAGPGRHSQC